MIKNKLLSNELRFVSLLSIGLEILILCCLFVLLTFSNVSANEQLELTAEERQWLAEHPIIRLGVDPDWPPFDFVDQHGYHQGVAADFLRLVSKQLSLTIEMVPNITWTEVLDQAKLRQLDLVSIAAQTPDRSKYLSYTDPVISSSSVIVVNDQQSEISGVDSLIGKKVGVVKGYSAAELAMKTHTQLTFIEVDSVLDGLKKTANGELDAFIDNLGVVGHLISEHSLSSLRIAGDAELGTLELSFGVRKDWPELVSILNKALATIPPVESRVIRNRWIPIRASLNTETDPESTSGSLNWWLLGILALFGFFAIIALGRILDRPVTDGEVQQLTKAHKFWLAVTFARMKISAKILIMLVMISTASVVIFGYFDYQSAKETLKAESFKKLTAVREMKAQQIENYFSTLNDLVVTFARSDTVVNAAKGFRGAFEKINENMTFDEITESTLLHYYEKEFITRLSPNVLDSSNLDVNRFISQNPATQYLQKKFIVENPYPTGEKHKFYRLEDGSHYDVAHTRHHPTFKQLLEKFGFYDIFIVDPKDGYILYSVFKEVDYGTSLLTGPYKDSNFAAAYRQVIQNPKPGTAVLVDFEPYEPSYNAPAAFISAPIFENRNLVGVAIFQMPIDRINAIMTSNQSWSNVGLGESGETYIIGDDFRMRNQSRFLIQDRENYFKAIQESGAPSEIVNHIKAFNSSIGLQRVETRGTIAALSGRTSTEIFPDYRNVQVLSAFRPLNIQGMRWALMSEIDVSEAFASVEELKKRMMILISIMLVSIIGISFVFAKTMTRPIKVLTAKAETLAKGDLGIDIDVGGGDEISDLAHSFDMMRNALREMIEGLEEKVRERTLKLEKAESRMRGIVTNLADALVIISDEGVIEDFGPSAETMFGYKASEVLGKNVSLLMPSPHSEAHDSYLEKYRNTGEAYVVGRAREVLAKRKNGELFDVELAVSEATMADNRIFIGLIKDITPRKKAEEALQAAYKIINQQKERMEEELNVGRNIQMSMVPQCFPAFPDRNEFDIHGLLQPAREIGGDFYDFFFVGQDKLFVCVGDVSGKGVPAALFMAVTKTMIKVTAGEDHSTASIMTRVNDEISQDNPSSMFITLFLGVLDLTSGDFCYTNAGHPYPYLKRSNGKLETLKPVHGPVVGAIDGIAYGENQVQLVRDDRLLIFTDGITEAMDLDDQLYGEQRVIEHFQAYQDANCADLVKETLDEVEHFAGEAEQADDITVLALKYCIDPKSDETMLDISLPNRLPEIDRVNDTFTEFAEQCGIEMTIALKINMVFDDLLTNIISYAYGEDKTEHSIEIGLSYTDSRLSITIADDGIPFNPFTREDPDTNLGIEEREIGGLGILLVKKTMDETTYQRRNNRNIITLIKNLN